MNCKFTNVLLFAVGAAIGSAVTYKVVKDRYEQIVQEEIESVKEAFSDRLANLQDQVDDYVTADAAEEWADRTKQVNWPELEDVEDDNSYEDDLNEYARILNEYTKEEGGAKDMTKEPYVISPYDFGELDGYRQIELTYYADGTLEDENYDIVTDYEEVIGRDSLNTFGEYEDDAVFVRNDHLQTDFQILKDYRTYEEARSVGPKQGDY